LSEWSVRILFLLDNSSTFIYQQLSFKSSIRDMPRVHEQPKSAIDSLPKTLTTDLEIIAFFIRPELRTSAIAKLR
jgi:hypothetical protein